MSEKAVDTALPKALKDFFKNLIVIDDGQITTRDRGRLPSDQEAAVALLYQTFSEEARRAAIEELASTLPPENELARTLPPEKVRRGKQHKILFFSK